MRLSKGKTDTVYRIVETTAEGTARERLDSLGIVPDETIYVISSSYAGLIVEVKGSRLAICKSMADKIEASEVRHDG